METLHYPIAHYLSSCAQSQDPCNVWILRLRFAVRCNDGRGFAGASYMKGYFAKPLDEILPGFR
jgi:hypothetical protein